MARIRGNAVSGTDASDRTIDGVAEMHKTDAAALHLALVNGWASMSAIVRGPVDIPAEMLEDVKNIAKSQTVEKRATAARSITTATKVTYVQMNHHVGSCEG